jgi:hypothetical protein
MSGKLTVSNKDGRRWEESHGVERDAGVGRRAEGEGVAAARD